jgi:tetratricopeptide (TPR) repeat protein
MASAADSPERERLGELFERACALRSTDREAFLDRECGDDPQLHAELTSLLVAHDRVPDPLERMASDLLPGALRGLAQSMWPVGHTVAHYHVDAVIGHGGMGVVYRARDLTLGRTVALKFLRPSLTDDHEARVRLETEAKAASALDHPNVAIVHEIGAVTSPLNDADGDRLFIAMAYYPGETLRDKISRGPLPISEAVGYATQIAAGLACAHDAGIVHRDIKPANVMVNERGEAKILDFGVSRTQGSDLTQHGHALGTVAYMSPEQTRGAEVDHRTDVWSLGVLLYEMLTGTKPFRGADETVQIHAIRHDSPMPVRSVRPECPASLAHIVETCLAKDPAARYPRAGEIVAALGVGAHESAVDQDAATAGVAAATSPPRPGRRIRPSPRQLVAMGAVVVIVAAAAGVIFYGDRPVRIDHAGALTEPKVAHVVVFPFAATSADSALERLGRDLALALSSALDGIDDIRTIDPLAALAQARDRSSPSLSESHRLARELNASRFIHGALTRSDTRLRLDAWWYDVGGAAPLARVTVSADHLDALTDAATVALLDRLWQRQPPALANAAVAMKSSVPLARRAFLDGERALSQKDMPAAIAAFERAFALDTTFWWAYWRSLAPRLYTGTRWDPIAMQTVIDRRWELPTPDRLLIEAEQLSSSTSERIRRLELLLDNHPDHALALWVYASYLARIGTYLGHSTAEARSAFERLLVLDPGLAAAWNRLQWIATVQGDSATAQRAAREAARLDEASDARSKRLLRASLFESGPIPPDKLAEFIEFMLSTPPGIAENVSSGIVADGFPAKQIQLNRAARERGVGHSMEAALWRGEALSWAARGAWDSAMAAADRWVIAGSRADAAAELGAYRLAVAGAVVGGVTPARAAARREAAADAIGRMLRSGIACKPPALNVDSAPRVTAPPSGLHCEAQVRRAVYQRSDLTWLDGLLAYLNHDVQGIATARARLFSGADLPRPVGSSFVSPWDSNSRPILDRSLAALALAAAGNELQAARMLAVIEMDVANEYSVSQYAFMHPLLASANRILAARLLRRTGRSADAAPLLNWHEAMLPHAQAEQAWNRAIGSVTLLDRAELAELAADTASALRDYQRFLGWYDAPDPALRPLRDRAVAGVQRLARP